MTNKSEPVDTDALRETSKRLAGVHIRGSNLAVVRARSELESAADQLDAVRAEVTRYAGWHEQSPEDSWRFERDIRAALGMEQYSGDDND